jgi:hypothetical protein
VPASLLRKKLEFETKKYESENQFDFANEMLGQIQNLKKIENEKLYCEIKDRQAKEVSPWLIIEK